MSSSISSPVTLSAENNLLNTRNALLARIMDHYRTIHNLKGEVSEAENQLKGVKEARGKQTELNGKAVDFYQYILKTYKELQAYKERDVNSVFENLIKKLKKLQANCNTDVENLDALLNSYFKDVYKVNAKRTHERIQPIELPEKYEPDTDESDTDESDTDGTGTNKPDTDESDTDGTGTNKPDTDELDNE